MSSLATTRRQRFSDDDLLDAALEVFGAVGYQAAQISDIARQARTTKPTLYARLGSKGEIYTYVLEREADILKAWLFSAYARAKDLPLRQAIELSVEPFFRFAHERRPGFNLLFRSDPAGPARSFGERLTGEIIANLTRLLAITLAGSPLETQSELVAAACVGVALEVGLHAVDTKRDLDLAGGLAATFIEAALRAVRAQPEP